jgi:hypothetical protein
MYPHDSYAALLINLLVPLALSLSVAAVAWLHRYIKQFLSALGGYANLLVRNIKIFMAVTNELMFLMNLCHGHFSFGELYPHYSYAALSVNSLVPLQLSLSVAVVIWL